MDRVRVDPIPALHILAALAVVTSGGPRALAAQPAPRVAIAWTTSADFDIPESVAWDPVRRVFYVSNIVGNFGEKDGNGFLSVLEEDGSIRDVRWVEGLDAPKGIAVRGDTIYVADLDRLLLVRLPDGAVLKRFPAEGARFLNGVSVAGDGAVYATDTVSGAIFLLRDGVFEEWVADPTLAGANGLLAEEGRVLVGSYTTGATFSVDRRTREIERLGVEIVGFDGLVGLGGGRYLASDWNGRLVLTDFADLREVVLDTRADRVNAADLEYVAESGLVVVPTFFDNRVVAYRLHH